MKRVQLFLYLCVGVLLSKAASATHSRRFVLDKKQPKHELELRLERRACRFQLREQRVPIRCYSALDLERRMKKIDHSLANRLLNKLDRQCLRVAKHDVLLDERENLRFLTPLCRERVQQSLAERTYREQGLLHQHWQTD